MKICILHINDPEASGDSNHYPSSIRFQNAINPFLKVDWDVISAVNDTLPDANNYDGYLITGGKYSAFEDYPWQEDLREFIITLNDKKIPLVGICYGHQIITEALGGKVVRSDKGWGVGIKESKVVVKPDWMQDTPEAVSLYSMHQDQVEKLAEGATTFLSSDFCKEAGYIIGNHILGIQQHPDFNAEICRDLILKRRERIGDVADVALQSLTNAHHTELSSKWIADFFSQHQKK